MSARPRRKHPEREPEQPTKVTIRYIEPRVWREFRSIVVAKGMRDGDQLTLILREWNARNKPHFDDVQDHDGESRRAS